MATYTNESLQSIKKKDMIPIVLSLQNKLNQVNNKVLAEIHKLSNNFSKLESKLFKKLGCTIPSDGTEACR